MTAVFSTSNFNAYNSSNVLRIYTIEVITFDGDSHIFEIEAYDGDEALNIAASMVGDADYAMIQGVQVA